MTLSPQFLDDLRQRITMSTLIGKSMKLVKAGREFKGCCPFHTEKTASFYVNDDKGFYHCFGCSAHGDVIRWLTDYRGLPFMDAVRELASAAGIEVPASDPRYAEKRQEDAGLHEIMQRAARWMQQTLWTGNVGEQAKLYLGARGIGGNAATDFELGYAPQSRRGDESPLRKALHDVDPARLVDLGLLKQSEQDQHLYDFFRDRLMIPIHDTRGRVIGFGGRKIGAGEPKYLNSPDTPVFDKGRTLFNYHRAAGPARKSNRLVVVEGYLDVIALTSVGIHECVAPNGTALTEEQMLLCWRLCPCPVLCFDGDKAGRGAAAKAAVRALRGLEAGRTFRFAFPDDGQDPDDVVRKGGAPAMIAILDRSKSLFDVLFEHESSQNPLISPDAKASFRAKMREHIGNIPDNGVREEYWTEFKRRMDAMHAPTSNRGENRGSRRADPPSTAARSVSANGLGEKVGRAVLYALLDQPARLERFWEALSSAQFQDPDFETLKSALVEIALTPGALETARFQHELDERRVGAIAGIVRRSRPLPFPFLKPDHPDAEQALAAAIAGIA